MLSYLAAPILVVGDLVKSTVQSVHVLQCAVVVGCCVCLGGVVSQWVLNLSNSSSGVFPRAPVATFLEMDTTGGIFVKLDTYIKSFISFISICNSSAHARSSMWWCATAVSSAWYCRHGRF